MSLRRIETVRRHRDVIALRRIEVCTTSLWCHVHAGALLSRKTWKTFKKMSSTKHLKRCLPLTKMKEKHGSVPMHLKLFLSVAGKIVSELKA